LEVTPAPDLLDFHDTKKLYAHKSTAELMFNYTILKACSWKWLVKAAPKIVDIVTPRPFLSKAVMTFVRPTFFRQFCCGESIEDSRPALEKLRKAGIGAILEYAQFPPRFAA
jgi:proline dehydrogenase